MRKFSVALAICMVVMGAVAMNTNEDVVELIDAGKVPSGKAAALAKAASHDITHPGDGTQTGRVGALPTRPAPAGQPPIPNFPGTPYGKPGYKESHNWENDIDYFSPLIFNWKIYAAMYGLKDKTEEAVRKDWMDVGMKADAKYPDCRQGTLTFSPNKYYRANPEPLEKTEGNCKKIIESFLKDGLFQGLQAESADAERRYEEKLAKDKLMAIKGNVATKQFYRPYRRRRHSKHATWSIWRRAAQPWRSWQSTQEYTLTWWQRPRGRGFHRSWSNILHYGNHNHYRAPGVWMAPNHNRLHIRVSQSNSWNWGCDPLVHLNQGSAKTPTDPRATVRHFVRDRRHWYFVAFAVGKQDKACKGNCKAQMEVYMDGKMVRKCTSTGYTRTWNNHHFWTTDPWYRSAPAVLKDLSHYPGTPLSPEIIAAEHSVVRSMKKLR